MAFNPYEQDASYQQHVHANLIPQDSHSHSDNPWASEGSPTRNPYSQSTSQPTSQAPSHNNPYSQQTTYQPLASNPPDPLSPPLYNNTTASNNNHSNPWDASPPNQYPNSPTSNRPQHPLEAASYYSTPAPSLPPRRSATDVALPVGEERAEQVETLQAYEASKEMSEDERNQAILQREFPKMDGSLIAAIYGDSKSLSATRELLQELDDGGS